MSSLQDLKDRLDSSKPLSFDVETIDYDKWSTTKVAVMSFYQEGWDDSYVITTIPNDEIGLDLRIIEFWDYIHNFHLIGHNILYDFTSIKQSYLRLNIPFSIPEKFDDTLHLTRLQFPKLNLGKGYSLDNVIPSLLNIDPYKERGLNKKDLQKSFEHLHLCSQVTEEQKIYAGLDTRYLLQIYNLCKDSHSHPVYILDKELYLTLLRDVKGLPLDLNNLEKIESQECSDPDLITFNVNSYMQVREHLSTILSSSEEHLSIMACRKDGIKGIKFPLNSLPKKFTVNDFYSCIFYKYSFGEFEEIKTFNELKECFNSSGKPEKGIKVYYEEIVDDSSIEKNRKLAQAIIRERKRLKRLNFCKRARSAMEYDNENIPRVKGHFSPHAINGRIQVDNENLSQYPRTMKSIWGHSSNSGRVLIYSDFAQIELRIICALLPEMNMYKALKEGIDLHSFVAKNLGISEEDLKHLGEGVTPRFLAKQLNFLLLYGGGLTNFQRTVAKLSNLWLDDDLAQTITTRWKDIFSDIKEWHLANSKKEERIDATALGRRYYAKNITDLNNIKVSGTGAEIFKTWLIKIDKNILDNYPDTYIVNRVHDSVILDVPDNPDIYKPIADTLAQLAKESWFEVLEKGKSLGNVALDDVPMPADAYVGYNWEDIEYERNLLYKTSVNGEKDG